MPRIGLIKVMIVTATLTMAGIASSADGQDPFVGTWILNVSKSTFDPGPPMKSHSFKIEQMPDGAFHNTIDLVEADGTRTHMEFTTARNGKWVPVTGTTYADSVSVAKTGNRSFKYAFKKDGKRIESGTFTVADDGKTMLGDLSGNDGGVLWKYHWVSERQ